MAARFTGEEITLSVAGDSAQVRGCYHFENRGTVTREVPLLFPFHVDGNTAYPHDVRVRVVQRGDTLEVPWKRLGATAAICFTIPVAADTVTTWVVDYVQRSTAPCARYILVSALQWPEALQSATYHFLLPDSLHVREIWPPPDSSAVRQGKRMLWCTRRDFRPARDMVLCWDPPRQPGHK